MKHTPGPWALSIGPNAWNLAIVPKSGPPEVIAVPTNHALQAFPNGQDVMTANARLIAAAPEMLECLRSLTSAVNEKEPDPLIVFAAIEKSRALLKRIEE